MENINLTVGKLKEIDKRGGYVNYGDIFSLYYGKKLKFYEEFGDYQGTYVVILEDNHIFIDYFGSCSGCDSLEDIRNYDDNWNENKIKQLEEYIESIDSYTLEHVLSHFKDFDLEGIDAKEKILKAIGVKEAQE